MLGTDPSLIIVMPVIDLDLKRSCKIDSFEKQHSLQNIDVTVFHLLGELFCYFKFEYSLHCLPFAAVLKPFRNNIFHSTFVDAFLT
jgi:hypothetical protein